MAEEQQSYGHDSLYRLTAANRQPDEGDAEREQKPVHDGWEQQPLDGGERQPSPELCQNGISKCATIKNSRGVMSIDIVSWLGSSASF